MALSLAVVNVVAMFLASEDNCQLRIEEESMGMEKPPIKAATASVTTISVRENPLSFSITLTSAIWSADVVLLSLDVGDAPDSGCLTAFLIGAECHTVL